MMWRFVRPALCRLCECPVGSDGVPLSRLDTMKLSRWWNEALQTDFEDKKLEKKFFCQFCLWDAKFQGEKKGSEGCDWWTGHDTNRYLEKYYYHDEVIRPCHVAVSWTSRKKKPAGWGVKLKTDCIYCSESFESRREAFAHVARAHKGVETFWCKDCALHFRTSREKDAHYEKVHLRHFKVRCHLCFKKIDQSILARHISQNHFDLVCCGLEFPNALELRNHMKSILVYKMVECVYCRESIPINQLPKHVRVHHASEAIKCPYRLCGIYFLTEDEKLEHVAKVHEAAKDLQRCIYCQRKFSRHNLTRHVLLVHKTQVVRCDFNVKCCVFFHSDEERLRHVQQIHNSGENPIVAPVAEWKCNRCAEVLTSKQSLTAHSKRFHRVEPKYCKAAKCSENFSSDKKLQKHFLEKHSAEEERKIFRCSRCCFKSHSLVYLDRHERWKHGTGKFQCQLCQKFYKSKLALRQHMLYHLDKKVCPHCSTSVFCLKPHLTTAGPCRTCDEPFACKGQRKSHMQKCKK